MSPPPNELFTAFSFIGFVMCVIPFYWHFQARNMGTCLYMAWTGLGCLILCIDSIVWNKNMIIRAPVYCDIASRFQVALNAALPACSLCIQRRLYKCSTLTTAVVTREEKRREVIIDLFIGLGIPILQIVSEYIVSGRRYVLVEDYGPAHHTVLTPAAFPLYFAWPVAIGAISFVYCVMNIYHLYRRKRLFKDMPVISSGSGLSESLYIRLMALSTVEMLGTIPLGSFWIAFSIKRGLAKWGSWAEIHSYYSVIHQIPSIVWKHDSTMIVTLELSRWSLILCAFLFFVFFGLAEEAMKHYRLVYTSLAHLIGSSNTFPCSSNRAQASSHPMNSGIVFAARRNSATSFSVQPSIRSTRKSNDLSKVGKYPVLEPMGSSSVLGFPDGPQVQSHQSAIALEFVPASVPLQVTDKADLIAGIQSTSTAPVDGADAV